MQLTSKLLGYLHRAFDKNPDPFVALRVRYLSGGLTWSVADGSLTLTPSGGPGAAVTYDLSQYTLKSLAADIAGRKGFKVAFLDGERAKLSALVLLDGSGDQSLSNGDAMLGYTSLLWAIYEAMAVQLQALRDQVQQVVNQMSTTSAEGVWLDYLGGYFDVPRSTGEADGIYGPRIIATVLRPKCNNVAIEMAIEEFTGQPCKVDNVVIYRGTFPLYDGSIVYDGTHTYNNEGLPNYGLFDVTVAYDLVKGGDIGAFTTTVQSIVEKLRAGGTFLRAVSLSSSATPMSDAATAPTETPVSSLTASVTNTDAFTAPGETPSGYTGSMTDTIEALAAPSEVCDGQVYSQLTTEAGAAITDDSGNPLLVSVGPLFA